MSRHKKRTTPAAPVAARTPWWRWPVSAPVPRSWTRGAVDFAAVLFIITLTAHRHWDAAPPFADDIQQVQVSESSYMRRSVAEGHLPRYDYWTSSPFEIPLSRTIPFSVWYLGALSMPWGEAVGVKLAMGLMLVIGAWGARTLVMRWTGSRLAACLGGVIYALNRFALFEHIAAGHFGMTELFAILPWWMVCLDRSMTVAAPVPGAASPRGDPRWYVLSGAVGGLMVLGDIQYGGMCWIIGLCYLIARFVGAETALSRRTVLTGSAVILGCAAVTSAYMVTSLLSFQPYADFQKYASHWLESLTTTWEYAVLHWAPIWEGPQGWVSRFSASPHVSWLSAWPWIPLVALLIWARDARTYFLLVLYLLSMGMALAHNGPLSVFYHYVPFFKMFRTPIRFYNITGFAMSCVVPMGLWAIKDRVATQAEPVVKSVMMTVCGLLLVFGVFDGPKAWEPFKTGLMYSGHEEAYRWSADHAPAAPVSFSQYPFNFMENRSTRWGMTQHGFRDPMGVGHTINTRYSANAFRFANLELSIEGLHKFFQVAAIGFVLPRTPEAAENLGRAPGLTLVFRNDSDVIVRPSAPVSLVRVVGDVVGIIGSEASLASQQLFNDPGFRPDQMVSVAADTPDEERALRAYLLPERMMALPYLPRWQRVRSEGAETTLSSDGQAARLTVRGAAGAWNGWKRGRVGIDTAATPRFGLHCKGSPNAKLRLKFFMEDGQEFQTEWSDPPRDWQQIGLPFRGGAAIHGVAVFVQTTDGRDAWLDMREMTVTGDQAASPVIIDAFQSVRIAPVRLSLPPAPSTAVLRADSSMPSRAHYACEVDNAGSLSFVTIAERWYPMWRASVDGKTVPVFRAYGAFLAIPVQGAGRHRVEVHFGRTVAQWMGWALTAGMGMAAAVCAAWLAWRPHNR